MNLGTFCADIIHVTAKGVSMDRHCERVLRQIAFGYVLTPSGRMRKMYNHEMASLACEACDHLGIAYSNGACEPFKPMARPASASAAFAAQDAGGLCRMLGPFARQSGIQTK